MPTFSGIVLSGSTNGRPIPVAATATPGTTLHVVGASGWEEVFIFASNVTATPATLTVEWGGTTDPGDHLVKGYSLPANSTAIPVAVGQRLQGGVTVRAFGSVASAINITGWANKVV